MEQFTPRNVCCNREQFENAIQGETIIDPVKNLTNPIGQPSTFYRSITAQPLAARQVVSKELPTFSGDPLEWPMFLNAFESTTALCGIQPDENLARLQRSLTGCAREKVRSILTLPEAIPEIINILSTECGRPDQLVHCLLARIRKTTQPSINKLDSLVTFGREVRNLVTYMQSANLHSHLDNPSMLSELVFKLPPDLRLQWGIHLAFIPKPSLEAFSNFVTTLRSAACQVAMPSDHCSNEEVAKRNKGKERTGYLNAHSNDSSDISSDPDRIKTDQKPCLACHSVDHKIRFCRIFHGMTLQSKLKLVEENGMCHRCLVPHGKWTCRTKQPCGVGGCREAHHKLLHPEEIESHQENGSNEFATVATHNHSRQNSTLFKILPVTVHANGKSVSTFAFLDDGSDVTLVEDGLADELGIVGEESPLCLKWTSDVTRIESTSRKVQFALSGKRNQTKHVLTNVHSAHSKSPGITPSKFELLPNFESIPIPPWASN